MAKILKKFRKKHRKAEKILDTADDVLAALGIEVPEIPEAVEELTPELNILGQDGQDGFNSLLSKFYGFAAEDYVHGYLSGLGATEFFQGKIQAIPEIKSAKDFEEFLKILPKQEEVRAAVANEVKRDYAGIEKELAEIQAKRAEALKDPELDYKNFWDELNADVNLKLNFTANVKRAENKKEFQIQRARLVKEVSRTLEARLGAVVNNKRAGDEVRIVNALGFDVEENTPTYYYSGDFDDIALGSVGELVEISSEDSLSVKFNEQIWQMHPDEVSLTGRNIYADLVRNNNGFNGAGEKVVAELEEKLKGPYTEKAKQIIDRIFDAKIQQTANAVKTKFKLTPAQLNALANGNEINYRINDADADLSGSFGDLAKLARVVFRYKYGVEGNAVGDVDSEVRFKNYIIRSAKLCGKNKQKAFERVLDITGTVLERQVRATERLKDVDRNSRLRTTLSSLTYSETSTKRKAMYNDSDLYVREPFSPPSESHDHVMILQPEYGCTHACTFCTGNEVKLKVRTPEEFKEHVKKVKKMLGNDFFEIRRIFLDGANVFRHSADDLIRYLDIVSNEFKGHVNRIAAYTRTEGLTGKSIEDLNRIYDHGMRVVYWGVESGSDAVLKYVNKQTSFEKMKEAAKNIRASNLQASVMIMPGLGGIRFYEDHVVKTAKLVDLIKPRFLTFLSINPDFNSKYAQKMREEITKGENMPLTQEMVAEQIYDMLRLMKGDYTCLAASYFAPNDKVGINPGAFRARFEYGDKPHVLREIEKYFTKEHMPSPLIPVGDFNKDSPLRRLALKKK